MGEHHAFGFAGAAAGENHGGQIVQRFAVFARAERAFEQRAGQEPAARSAAIFSPRRGAGGDFFEQDRFPGHLQLKLFEQELAR